MQVSAPPDTDGRLPPGQLRAMVLGLAQAHANSRAAINLVPSETRLSPLAASALHTDFYNRYFFNDRLDPAFWQFRGGQPVCEFETDLTIPSMRRLSGAEHVNVRPISGMSAMLVAMSALGGPPGRTVVSIRQDSGGHYATASVARRLGFRSVTIAVRHGEVDQDELRAALLGRPAAVYLDLQNSRHVLNVRAVAAAVAELSPDTSVHADCSHTLGLVLGGALPNPLDEGADSMGGSTHKTFPGPHKGVLLTRRPDLAERFREAQFCLLSSHHFAETIALGLAAAEFEHFGQEYARRVVTNARTLEAALAAAGFDVAADGDHATETHQVWVRVGDADRTLGLAETMYHAGLRVNVQVDLPGIPGQVLRLGVNEITFEGAGEAAMGLLGSAFAHARDRDMARLVRAVSDVRDALDRPCYFTDLGLDNGGRAVPAEPGGWLTASAGGRP